MPVGAPQKVAILSQALVRLGERPISDLDSSTGPAQTASTLYEDIKKAQLYNHNWRFAMRYMAADPLATKEKNYTPDYEYEYLLPPDFLRIIGLRETNNWQTFHDRLYSEFNSVHILYLANAKEILFSPAFADALKTQLAYEMCSAVRDDLSLQQVLEREARRKWGIARVFDSRTSLADDANRIYQAVVNSEALHRW